MSGGLINSVRGVVVRFVSRMDPSREGHEATMLAVEGYVQRCQEVSTIASVAANEAVQMASVYRLYARPPEPALPADMQSLLDLLP